MKHNFGAGPCILPQEVFQEAAAAVLDFNGLSILEVSHRHKDFVAVMDEAIALVKKALHVPDGYSVAFLQGGATLGFTIAALNMQRQTKRAGYINTGTWASGAIKEAKKVGIDVDVFASSEDQNFTYIPKNYNVPTDVDYIHLTSNNTIYGTQFKDFPKTNLPLVCDMSSDIFSQEINVADFDLIYAGAQKNLGPAGLALVIVREDLLGHALKETPSLLDYSVYAGSHSLANTNNTFAIYMMGLVLEWVKQQGGVATLEAQNETKAKLLYDVIDASEFYLGVADPAHRSIMNVTFNLAKPELLDAFVEQALDAGLYALKGHRDVGGARASIYNAMPLAGCEALAVFMRKFESENA